MSEVESAKELLLDALAVVANTYKWDDKTLSAALVAFHKHKHLFKDTFCIGRDYPLPASFLKNGVHTNTMELGGVYYKGEDNVWRPTEFQNVEFDLRGADYSQVNRVKCGWVKGCRLILPEHISELSLELSTCQVEADLLKRLKLSTLRIADCLDVGQFTKLTHLELAVVEYPDRVLNLSKHDSLESLILTTHRGQNAAKNNSIPKALFLPPSIKRIKIDGLSQTIRFSGMDAVPVSKGMDGLEKMFFTGCDHLEHILLDNLAYNLEIRYPNVYDGKRLPILPANFGTSEYNVNFENRPWIRTMHGAEWSKETNEWVDLIPPPIEDPREKSKRLLEAYMRLSDAGETDAARKMLEEMRETGF